MVEKNGPTVKLDKKVKEKLDEYCENTGRKKKWVASRAIEKYLEKTEG